MVTITLTIALSGPGFLGRAVQHSRQAPKHDNRWTVRTNMGLGSRNMQVGNTNHRTQLSSWRRYRCAKQWNPGFSFDNLKCQSGSRVQSVEWTVKSDQSKVLVTEVTVYSSHRQHLCQYRVVIATLVCVFNYLAQHSRGWNWNQILTDPILYFYIFINPQSMV